MKRKGKGHHEESKKALSQDEGGGCMRKIDTTQRTCEQEQAI